MMNSLKRVNSLEFIDSIRSKVTDMLIDIGFKETTVYFTCKLPDGTESETAYQYGGLHCLVTFLTCEDNQGFLKDWILIEYADSLHDAQFHIYEDGDMIPLDVDIATILSELSYEVKDAVKHINL